MDSRYYGNADTFLPPSATFHMFFSPAIRDTCDNFVKNPDSHNISKEKSDVTIKEKMRHMFDSKLTFKPFTLLEEFPFGLLSPFLRIPCHCRSLEVIIQHI